MSAAFFSERYPTARIIAVEPDPDNFRILQMNAALFPQIEPVNAAVWNRDGVVHLESNDRGNWGVQVANPGEGLSFSKSPSIRSLTMKTLFEEFDVHQVDILKIDVEGSECEIFENAPLWIDRVALVCAELHERFRPGCSAAFGSATGAFPLQWVQGELCCAARQLH